MAYRQNGNAPRLSGSKITAPVLGWVEDSVIRSDIPAVGVAESFSTCAYTRTVPLSDFHKVSRAAGPKGQMREKLDYLRTANAAGEDAEVKIPPGHHARHGRQGFPVRQRRDADLGQPNREHQLRAGRRQHQSARHRRSSPHSPFAPQNR